MESELSDSARTAVESEEEEEEEEEQAVPRRRRSTRSSFGLRVAFQFPTKKLAKTPDKGSSHLVDSKTDLRREKGCRQAKEREDSASESEDDSRTESQNSDALLKRAMNIKENKAMVRARRARRPTGALGRAGVLWGALACMMSSALGMGRLEDHLRPLQGSCPPGLRVEHG